MAAKYIKKYSKKEGVLDHTARHFLKTTSMEVHIRTLGALLHANNQLNVIFSFQPQLSSRMFAHTEDECHTTKRWPFVVQERGFGCSL